MEISDVTHIGGSGRTAGTISRRCRRSLAAVGCLRHEAQTDAAVPRGDALADDFDKGRRGEWSNVADQREYDRGAAFQRGLNSAMWQPPANGPVITGEHWLLQGIVSIPFIVAGALLYPMTAASTLIATLLCTRLVPLFGSSAGWVDSSPMSRC